MAAVSLLNNLWSHKLRYGEIKIKTKDSCDIMYMYTLGIGFWQLNITRSYHLCSSVTLDKLFNFIKSVWHVNYMQTYQSCNYTLIWIFLTVVKWPLLYMIIFRKCVPYPLSQSPLSSTFSYYQSEIFGHIAKLKIYNEIYQTMMYKAVTHLLLLTEWSFFVLEHGCSLESRSRVRIGMDPHGCLTLFSV